MKLNSFIETAIKKVKSTKIFNRGAAFIMAGVTLTSLSACSKEDRKNYSDENSSILAETYDEQANDNLLVVSGESYENQQLPSYYNCFNIFENSDINKKYGVAI